MMHATTASSTTIAACSCPFLWAESTPQLKYARAFKREPAMQAQQPFLSFPYKLPRWISLFLVLLLSLGLAGICYQANTTGFKTRTGAPVNPALLWFCIAVLVLCWLAVLRMFQLSFDSRLRLSLDENGISMPKHALSSTIIHLPYAQIASVAPHPLQPDILVVKTHRTMETYTIQCKGFSNRAAFEQVEAHLYQRVR